ncbi:MAG: glycosyltransferase family 2 protein [Gemmatimonadaceae bacterium]
MTVFAVVLNWGREADSIACVDSLVANAFPLSQVILVDNASPDGSGHRLHERYPDAPYLQAGTNLGYAGGNNLGVAHALSLGATWVLVLNNDTICEPGMLAALLEAGHADPRCAAVAPKIVRADDPTILWSDGGDFSPMRALGRQRGGGTTDILPEQRSPAACSFLTGCCLLLRAEAIARYDELFRAEYFAYVEDAELAIRLQRDGWRLVYQPHARLRHKVPPTGTLPPPWALQRRDRNRRRLAAEHFGPLAYLRFAAWFYPTRLLTIAVYLARGDGARARAVLDGAFGR